MNNFRSAAESGFVLRFRSLTDDASRGRTFPCDEAGRVDIDAMGTRTRIDYFYARTVIGREFARPAVQPADLH